MCMCNAAMCTCSQVHICSARPSNRLCIIDGLRLKAVVQHDSDSLGFLLWEAVPQPHPDRPFRQRCKLYTAEAVTRPKSCNPPKSTARPAHLSPSTDESSSASSSAPSVSARCAAWCCCGPCPCPWPLSWSCSGRWSPWCVRPPPSLLAAPADTEVRGRRVTGAAPGAPIEP